MKEITNATVETKIIKLAAGKNSIAYDLEDGDAAARNALHAGQQHVKYATIALISITQTKKV